MSLPSWLKNAMGSPDLAKQQASPFDVQASPFDVQAGPINSVAQGIGIAQPYNGDPAMIQAALNSYPGAFTQQYIPDTKAFGNPIEAVARRITDRLIEKMPVTAAIKVFSIEVRFNGTVGTVMVIFDAHRRNPTPGEPLTLHLTDDFPTDADISRILLAMP